MLRNKKFRGFEVTSSGPETEPQGISSGLTEVNNALTMVAYNLFDANIPETNINFNGIVHFLRTGDGLEDIVTLPTNESEQSAIIDLVKLLEDFLQNQAKTISSELTNKLENFIYTLTNKNLSRNYYYIQRMKDKLKEARNEMIKKGVVITDETEFIKSMKEAIAESDQGGLESLRT